MNSELLKIGWQNRYESLSPCAVIAFERAAVLLTEKLLLLDDKSLNTMQGISSRGMIFLIGSSENLPWADGAIYLGRDTQMPGILLPTTLKPDVSLDLFERVLKENFKQHIPFAALPQRIIPYGKAKALSRDVLQKWLSENR